MEIRHNELIQMYPIGYVHNIFKEAIFDEKMYSSVSHIVLKEEFQDGLKDITDFSKIYVLFYFDRSEGYNLIQKRRYDGKIAGVFASRSPRRPNSIGLTLVELLEVKGNMLTVRGLDAIDGTPVLDIKPFIENDMAGDDLRSA
ncbi:MAG: tRNA (N6-threonylcarbamoyladenosine(37)-N6)-methyltransferase TrmO [Methanomethylovorans sp.]|uniref:tRNA (N6-threonylcarbamoyladenosine(37)-N6)-methyltransferase TrmO n=1 Tax=Methanomethylovorans sp. TaxID=2758717 RepID=UPI000A831C1E|nr:tRNA (N6-threonylcarbamoyladenosine(37)-N6)-methyltransferase TrmO [Methanomethylovorans sp.]